MMLRWNYLLYFQVFQHFRWNTVWERSW